MAADEDDDYMGDLERFIPKEELLPSKTATQVRFTCLYSASCVLHILFRSRVLSTSFFWSAYDIHACISMNFLSSWIQSSISNILQLLILTVEESSGKMQALQIVQQIRVLVCYELDNWWAVGVACNWLFRLSVSIVNVQFCTFSWPKGSYRGEELRGLTCKQWENMTVWELKINLTLWRLYII